MSGTRHKTDGDNKSITVNMEKLWLKNQGQLTYQYNTKEVPVITFNDLAFIKMRNSMVFSAGRSPIWNRNQTALLMSWKMFSNTISVPGKNFSLQTIPTTSTVVDFDVRKNQPNFFDMVDRRINEYMAAKQAMKAYKEAYGYSDYDIYQLEPDDYAYDIMELVEEILDSTGDDWNDSDFAPIEDNTEQLEVNAKMGAKFSMDNKKTYAGGLISKFDLVQDMTDGSGNGIKSYDRGYEQHFIDAYTQLFAKFKNARDSRFKVDENGSLLNSTGEVYYIQKITSKEDAELIKQSLEDAKSTTYSEEDADTTVENLAIGNYVVTDAFYDFLVSLGRWDFVDGDFDKFIATRLSTEQAK